MAKVIAEDFASEENYEDGVVENTIVSELKDDTEIERLKKANARLELENDRLGLENQRFKADTDLRDLFAKGYSLILIGWLIAVIYILVHNRSNHYHFSDSVLIGLLATSTANIIGMVIIVLKNLFPSSEFTKASKKPTTKSTKSKK